MKNNITVFSTPSCPYCVMVKEYLKQQKIEYKDIDVSENQEAAFQMFEKSHNMGVPQLWINDEVVIGFDPEEIERLVHKN
jgi:glutaredoxin-like YruB-family protein